MHRVKAQWNPKGPFPEEPSNTCSCSRDIYQKTILSSFPHLHDIIVNWQFSKKKIIQAFRIKKTERISFLPHQREPCMNLGRDTEAFPHCCNTPVLQRCSMQLLDAQPIQVSGFPLKKGKRNIKINKRGNCTTPSMFNFPRNSSSLVTFTDKNPNLAHTPQGQAVHKTQSHVDPNIQFMHQLLNLKYAFQSTHQLHS